ncbi:MAG: YbjQ family protein [Wenzhouxiangella sp.]|nr:YbjQ family protein [Wenzhouxiangella sp.]MCH8476660.1 YbjQ family protein [Wenzhouxiangella sp.]TVR96857.1 MAG: YbjQ family protein [Wenzhouxiangellaceae bacterium]
MILCTTEQVPGRTIVRGLGLVRGNTVRAKHIGRDIVAALRNLVGGEVTEYSEMMVEARNEAINRMVDQARTLEADAIVGVRLVTSQVTTGAAELLAYGTAVKLQSE